MTTLLSLLGPNSILYALGAAVVVAYGFYWKGRSAGTKAEKAKRQAERIKAMEERHEMDREATEAERKVGEMTDDEARAEAMKFARKR